MNDINQTRHPDIKSSRSGTSRWTGLKSALPIVMGYLPIGFAFGVLAIQAGIGLFPTMLMSVFVFAGSAQLIAVGLIGGGASWLSDQLYGSFVVGVASLVLIQRLL